MSSVIHPRVSFLRTALPAAGVVLAVIVTGMVLRAWTGGTSVEMGVLRQVNAAHTPLLDGIALGFNWLFGSVVAMVLVLLCTGAILLVTRRPRVAIRFLLLVALPTVGAAVIKLLVHRARPDIPSLTHILVLEPGGLSFPSGHTSFAACLMLGLIVVVAGQRWRPFLIGAATVVILATAASRVYLGVHYPSDVMASIVYAIAAVTLVNAAWVLVMAHWDQRRPGVHAEPAYRGASDAQ